LRGFSSIEAEDEFIQVALEMGSAEAVMDAMAQRLALPKTRWTHGRSPCAAIGPTTFGIGWIEMSFVTISGLGLCR
jgi:hypothetical protein